MLRSGGIYTPEWVLKLKNAVSRHLTGHRFYCLSDVDVPCEWVKLRHNWPGWWSKIEVFDVVDGPTLYLDLDTLVLGSLEPIKTLKTFSMIDLRTTNQKGIGQSGVMYFPDRVRKVYDRFLSNPQWYMDYHKKHQKGMYLGDQAFIFDVLGSTDKITEKLPGFIRSYKLNCQDGPKNSAIVCFHGEPRLNEVKDQWVKRAWQS